MFNPTKPFRLATLSITRGIDMACLIADKPWPIRCCSVNAKGKQAHAQAIANGFLPHVTLQTDLLLMYSRCSDISNARLVFDDMPYRNMHSWNIMISSCVHNSLYDDALRHLYMLMETSLRPDHFTFPTLFKACARIRDCWLGMALHNWVIKLGLEDHVIVGSSMLDMYAKCGFLVSAHQLFVNMRYKDAVVWNALISGFERAGLSTESILLFREMQWDRVERDLMAVPNVLSACGTVGDLSKGKEIHGKLIRHLVFDFDVAVGNSLLDMYAKCGCLDDSRKVFLIMPNRDLVTWTTLISCCGVHGKGEESLVLYEEMLAQGFKPNSITFTSVLSSCSHSGLIHQGERVFKSMNLEHRIEPSAEHYACMVDLLGRCGFIEEALELIENMPMEPAGSVWGALLGACTMHKNVGIAEIAAHRLFDLEAGNSSNYIALCSIYDALGMRDGVSKIRSRMKKMGLVKMPGCSLITVEGRVFTFYQGDVSHPLAAKIYDIVEGLLKTMVFSEGYG